MINLVVKIAKKLPYPSNNFLTSIKLSFFEPIFQNFDQKSPTKSKILKCVLKYQNCPKNKTRTKLSKFCKKYAQLNFRPKNFNLKLVFNNSYDKESHWPKITDMVK